MADTFHFTKQALLALAAASAGKTYEVRDEKVPGLILRVTSTGGKTFYYYKWTQGAPKRHLIGKFPALTIEQARKQAQVMTGTVARGSDPSAKPVLAGLVTLEDLYQWWHRIYGVHLRSIKQLDLRYQRDLAGWGKRPLVEITRADVRQLHAKVGEKSQTSANLTVGFIRLMFSKAIAEDLFSGNNPATHIKMYPTQSRERRLSREEADRLFKALDSSRDETLRDVVCLLLFTGARKMNVLGMAWKDMDFEAQTWTVPAEKSKNQRPIVIPLLAQEMEILKRRQAASASEWVFPARGKTSTGHYMGLRRAWDDLMDEAEIDEFHIHDLRRSLGSFMADTGAGLLTIGKALGHQSQAATAIYARISLDPVKEAKAKAIAAMGRGGS